MPQANQLTLARDDKSKASRRTYAAVSPGSQQPADVFPFMFGPPVSTFANFRPVSVAVARGLPERFTFDRLPDCAPGLVEAVLACCDRLPEKLELGVHDVGQGNACALLQDGRAWLFFGLGCGAYRNAPVTPTGLVFCQRKVEGSPSPKARRAHHVILSHWTADHWGGVFADPGNFGFLAGTWLAPRQEALPGIAHIGLAHGILRAGGQLILVPCGRRGNDCSPLPDGNGLTGIRGYALCDAALRKRAAIALPAAPGFPLPQHPLR